LPHNRLTANEISQRIYKVLPTVGSIQAVGCENRGIPPEARTMADVRLCGLRTGHGYPLHQDQLPLTSAASDRKQSIV